MKKIEFFELIADLFKFKSIFDEVKNEYVVFEYSTLNSISERTDKTEFEAIENHVHLFDHVKKEEFERFIKIAPSLGKTVLCMLKSQYPDKNFFVYVSISLRDSFILRFHQKWEGEEPYYDVSSFSSPYERVFMFEG